MYNGHSGFKHRIDEITSHLFCDLSLVIKLIENVHSTHSELPMKRKK